MGFGDKIAWLAVRLHDNKMTATPWDIEATRTACKRLRLYFFAYYPNAPDNHSYVLFSDPRRPSNDEKLHGVAIRDDMFFAELSIPMDYVDGSFMVSESGPELAALVIAPHEWMPVFDESDVNR